MKLRTLIIPGLAATCLSASVIAAEATKIKPAGASLGKISLIKSNTSARKAHQVKQQIKQQGLIKGLKKPKGTLLLPSKDRGFSIK